MNSILLNKAKKVVMLYIVAVIAHIINLIVQLGVYAGVIAIDRYVYLMLIFGLISLLGIVALIMAYMQRSQADAILATHYQYIIRTFWIGLLYGIIVGMIVHLTTEQPQMINGQLMKPLDTVSLLIIGVLNSLTCIFLLGRLLKSRHYLILQQAITNQTTWVI